MWTCSLFRDHNAFLYIRVSILAFVFIGPLLLGETLSFSVVHAVGGQASFDIKPVFSDPHNPVTQAYFVMNGKAATRIQNSLLVTNSGSATGTVNLYSVDAFTAATGGTAFYTRTDARKDVGAWIVLSRQQLTLVPGESQAVPFQVIIPGHVRSGQHVGGIAAEGSTVQTFTAKKLNISLQQRRIIAVQVNLPGPSIEKLITTGIRPGEVKSIYQQLLLGLSNTGTMMIKPAGHLQISDLNGHLLQDLALHLNTFLPATSINDPIYIQHKALPVGQYKAVLSLAYGHKQQLSYTTLFTIISTQKTLPNAISTLVALGDSKDFFSLLAPWQIVLGAGILLLVIGGLSFWVYKFFALAVRLCYRIKQKKPVVEGGKQKR